MFEQRVAATAGVRFQYAVAGDGPPVVLLPGSGGWRPTFDDMITRLSTGYRVYAMDPPGQGGTRVTDSGFGYDADAIARSVGEFLDAVGLPAAAFVGHSWGGGFALRLAQLHPDRVSGLALLADVWEFRLLRRALIGELATRFTSPAAVRHMLRKSFAHPDRMPAGTPLSAGCDAAAAAVGARMLSTALDDDEWVVVRQGVCRAPDRSRLWVDVVVVGAVSVTGAEGSPPGRRQRPSRCCVVVDRCGTAVLMHRGIVGDRRSRSGSSRVPVDGRTGRLFWPAGSDR